MRANNRLAGPVTGFLLSLLFGALLVGTVTFDLFMAPRVSAEGALPFTIRIPAMGVYKDTITGGASYKLISVRAARGEPLATKHARMVQAYEDLRRPPSTALLIGLTTGILLLLLLYAAYLRAQGRAGSALRTQLALFAALTFLAVASKALLLFTAWSAMWIPLIALTLPVTVCLGQRVGAATALAGAVLLSLLVPVDLPLLLVLAAQGLAASASARPHGGNRSALAGGIGAVVAAVLTFAAVSLLLVQYIPQGPLADGAWTLEAVLASDLIAAAGGPLLGCVLGLLFTPLLRRSLGHVSPAELSRLANFEHPLLRRLATRAPGTWAHSLNMANIAEMAANAISADGQLVRVGAYYHDLGKSVEPNYFIENQSGKNPHDEMPPEASADVIFSHVTGGIQLARKHGLPEAVVEFIYTHHATDRLEYFWHKNVKAGNQLGLSETDFCYQGTPPRSRETGILAICDAVEAASRTLKDPALDDIRKLVRQIVFTKLEKGILDESGLSMADLRRISDSMVESLRSAMHVRVKYPWQEKEEAAKRAPAPQASEAPPAPESVAAPAAAPVAPTAPAAETAPVVSAVTSEPLSGDEPEERPSSLRAGRGLRHKPTGALEPAWVDSPELTGEPDQETSG